MRVIEYGTCGRQEHWLAQIGRCDWGAGRFLYELLRDGTFPSAVGERSRVLLLTEGDELVSFCTYAEKDDIQPTDLTPWVGFVYTFPPYRGRRCFGQLLAHIEDLARAEGVRALYISTDKVGLYEKYGCEFYRIMRDREGEPSRVYRRIVG